MPNIEISNGSFTEKSELKKEKEKEKKSKDEWWIDVLTNKTNIILAVIILFLLYMLFRKFNANE